MAAIIEIVCGVVGPGCDPMPFNRKDDPFCLKRFLAYTYLLVRYVCGNYTGLLHDFNVRSYVANYFKAVRMCM